MIYLDSAAVVKLVHAEAESQALRDWLDERGGDWVDEFGSAGDRVITGPSTLRPRSHSPTSSGPRPDRVGGTGRQHSHPGPNCETGDRTEPGRYPPGNSSPHPLPAHFIRHGTTNDWPMLPRRPD